MGVNMAGFCIIDDEAVREASKQEIIRRYYNALSDRRMGISGDDAIYKLDLLMNQAHIQTFHRKVVEPAVQRAEQTGMPAAAIELPDGRIATGKTSNLLGASSSALLNALKMLAGIEHGEHIISPAILEPIQHLKVDHLGNHNPRLHTDETLIALSISAASNPQAERAMAQLDQLQGCEAHSSVILSQVDVSVFKKLGVNLTTEPEYQTKKLYHK